MGEHLEDRQFLQGSRQSGSHLRAALDKNILPRLKEIAEKEEVLVMVYFDMALTQGRSVNINIDELSDMVIGTHEQPTAVSLLFEMLGKNPEEPPRLEAGRILFTAAKMKLSDYRIENLNLLKDSLKSGLISDREAKRGASIWCLFKLFGAEAFVICAPVLSHSNPEVRFETARLFGFLKDKRAVPMLVEALKTERLPRGRSVILWALGYIKDPGALHVLIQYLEDEDAEAGGYAAWALGEIGGPEAIGALKTAMSDMSKQRAVRAWAARGLLAAESKERTEAKKYETKTEKEKEDIQQGSVNLTCRCGHRNPAGSKWCQKCGREVTL